MIGLRAKSRLSGAARFAFSALLVLTGVFSGRATAQEIRIERVGLSAPAGGAAAAAPAGALLPGAGFSPSGAPALLAPSFNPAASAPSAFAPAAVPALPAPAAVAARPRIAAPALAAPAISRDLETSGRIGSGATVDRPVRADGRLALPAATALDAAPPTAADGPRSAETDSEGARRDFSALLGERLVEGKGDVDGGAAASEKAVAASAAPRLAAARPLRAGARYFASVPALLAFGAHPNLAALFHPTLTTWHALSQAGYVAGNVGAAIFPLVQIYESLHGKPTPKSRAIVGAVASLALGLICAPILHKTLWGVQNIFGGLTLLVPLFIGSLAGRVRGKGLKETVLISAAALAMSAAGYFAIAAALPGLLAALFSAAAIAKIALVVQFTTSAMFLWMFLPDVVKVLRGKAAGGFTPGFNLMFFLSALGSMVWAVPAAWIYSGADQNTYRLIFAVNAIYALASFLSFWFARREAKPKSS